VAEAHRFALSILAALLFGGAARSSHLGPNEPEKFNVDYREWAEILRIVDAAAPAGTVVVLGDSITAALDVHRWQAAQSISGLAATPHAGFLDRVRNYQSLKERVCGRDRDRY
jgi:hypothetical protein